MYPTASALACRRRRGVRRLRQVPHGSPVIARLLEVRGERAGDIPRPVAVADLLPLADRLVQVPPSRRRDALIERVLMQGMHEPVARRHRSGPATRVLRANE